MGVFPFFHFPFFFLLFCCWFSLTLVVFFWWMFMQRWEKIMVCVWGQHILVLFLFNVRIYYNSNENIKSWPNSTVFIYNILSPNPNIFSSFQKHNPLRISSASFIKVLFSLLFFFFIFGKTYHNTGWYIIYIRTYVFGENEAYASVSQFFELDWEGSVSSTCSQTTKENRPGNEKLLWKSVLYTLVHLLPDLFSKCIPHPRYNQLLLSFQTKLSTNEAKTVIIIRPTLLTFPGWFLSLNSNPSSFWRWRMRNNDAFKNQYLSSRMYKFKTK